jgi:ABC-2 type transport system permease protein
VAGSTQATARRADRKPFASGGTWATLFRKEVRLLRRYPGLAGLAAYYLIYLVPAVAAIWHSSADGQSGSARMLGAAPVLSAGELARLFVSVTMMGDEAAELVATAPVSLRSSDWAKLAASSLGVAAIMAIPVVGLGISLPSAVPAMAAGMLGNVGCNLALGLWRPAPIRRTDLRRNHKGWGGLVNVAGFFFSATWSIATWQMLRGNGWAVLPICVAFVALWLCKPVER